MKKLILFFLIFLSYNLFPQTWEFIPQDSFLQFDDWYESYGRMKISSSIITKGDSTIFVRSKSDTIIMIYDYNKKEIFHILKEDFWKCLKNDSLYNVYKKSDIWELFIDSKENYWISIPDTLHKITPLFKVTPDTTYLINQIYVRELDSNIYISPFPNTTIRKIKEDKNGDIWLFIVQYIIFNDSLREEFEIMCKYVNDRFETIFMKELFYEYCSKCNFVIDSENRVWFVVADACYIIKDEEVEKIFSTQDVENGYGYFSELAIDSKDNFYATTNYLALFKYDGVSFTNDWRISLIEKELNVTRGYPYRMRIDSLDNLWFFGYESCNLYKIDSDGELTVYEVPKVDTSADNQWCYKMYMEIDKHGRLWIPAQSMGKSWGILIFDPDSTRTEVEERKESVSKDFQIFPNPAQNEVTFSIPENQNINSISIFNSLGTEVKRIEQAKIIGNSKITISTADFPNGLYHCSFVNQADRITKSFVILR